METKEDKKEIERKIKIRAAILTGVFNALLIVAILYIVAWAPPDPPLPEYGIEVNFGLDEIGSGDIQSKAPANDNESFDKAKPTPPAEEVKPTPRLEPTPKPTPQPVPEPVKETAEEAVEEVVTPIEAESEVAVEPVQEKPKEKPTPKPEPEKVEKPLPEQPKPTTETPKTTEEKPTEKVNTETILPSSTGTANEDQANNNGTGTQGEVGDQGNPQGNLNADALLGTASGGGGAALDMPGWKWDQSPDVVDQSTEIGKVVFEIKIDDEGEVVAVKTIYRSVSKIVANVYQQAVLDLTFTPEATEVKPITTGRITFVITSK